MNKLYTRIDWENNTTPAINETNLNLMSKGIDDIDDRVVYLANEVIGDTTTKMNYDGSNAASEVTFAGAFTVGSRASDSIVGTYSVVEGNGNEASGTYSHAEGRDTTASGDYSHTEGQDTIASGYNSHAECGGTTASGDNSHAEGRYTTASGDNSHAEGNRTTASGENSHAEGYNTKAGSESQHVQGKYNVEDTNNVYAHIVGGGTADNDRANIETLDWSGNLTVAGDVTDGSGNVLSAKMDSSEIGAVESADIENGIASFKSYIKRPVSDLIIGIEPVQSGSGDPSPTNVRPITGWSQVKVARIGKNLFDMSKVERRNTTRLQCKDFIKYHAGDQVVFSCNDSNVQIAIATEDSDGNILEDSGWLSSGQSYTIRYSGMQASVGMGIRYSDNRSISDDDIVSFKANKRIQLEFGATATVYEPYQGNIYTIDLNGTIYGGALNVTTGELTVDRANIASYAGETINEPWISSKDVYSPGATPTTGAQVVYTLATPTTTQLTAEEIITLLDTNDIFADTGDVTNCDYVVLTESKEDKADKTTIAKVEDGATASQAYAVGEHFIRDNAFCTCISAIAQGGSFTLNTNYTTGTVANSIEIINTNLNANNAGSHNSIYRGKYLGSGVTAAQYSAISAGTFEDLYIGDYWTIGGVDWRIAAFDYWLRTGDTQCTTHHVVIVPDTNLYNAKMNDTNTTAGGYVGSAMYTTNLASAKNTINTAFGSSHILTHRELLTNAVTDGKASGWAWFDSTVELMSETMLYGHNAWGSAPGFETGIDKGQLPLFRLDPSKITNRAHWWLRGVYTSAYFALVANDGYAYYGSASLSVGVRPDFAIK